MKFIGDIVIGPLVIVLVLAFVGSPIFAGVEIAHWLQGGREFPWAWTATALVFFGFIASVLYDGPGPAKAQPPANAQPPTTAQRPAQSPKPKKGWTAEKAEGYLAAQREARTASDEKTRARAARRAATLRREFDKWIRQRRERERQTSSDEPSGLAAD